MALTKTQVAEIRKDMMAKLAKVGKKHGITFDLGNIRFSLSDMKVGVKATVDGMLTPQQKAYDIQQIANPALPPRNSVIMMDGKAYRVDGWKSRAPKRPILLTQVLTEQVFVCPVGMVAGAEIFTKAD